MKHPKHYINSIQSFWNEEIWRLDLTQLGKYKRRMVKDLQVAQLMLKTFKEEKIGLQSASLSYFCFMSVVPFIAVAFALTGGLGLSGALYDFVNDKLGEYPFIKDQILEAATRILDTARSGWFGFFSALFFAWLVIWMMMCVERVFNSAWKVEKSRNFFKRFTTDLIIMILSPFLILIFSSTSFIYSNALDYVFPDSGFLVGFKSLLGWGIFGALSILVISAMYKYIPNTIVKYSNALKAAILAGLAFTILQYLYIETQLLVTRVNSVYGTVAAIPLFMLWMRFGWLILLYGCELSYSFQNLEDYKEEISAVSDKTTNS
ncbi:MAG: YihY/virulence factor BrkB family protein [Bacteroidales bacterium]|nr:YihY/virulence factor BrkB family protein [Bacteroidales bacterium]